ncbi:tripartite tricarboxylate transporter substrate binding protein [Mameliella sediminis]|uniref:tripartite tricarboxylate transporter substrate binding protein n=1 Tax=Mameliella sediminis TaxID=2836866 RepID=UPI001C448EB2|nr:tripartite tricarboxylate transporter substrate binding protein [Mameliella sediminis]MBV7395756.1 tripartite tricarboxylate transporter substrate binding protein [Mameliella sediminis]
MTLKTRLLAATALLAFAAPACADYPEKPINMIVGFRAGGGSDTAARILATELEAIMGQKIIVENRGGAGGAVAAEYLRRQPADGYSIGFAVATTFAFTPLTGGVAYSPDDVTFIATTHGYRTVYAAPPDAPFDDWEGMLAAAKDRGWINYASIIPLDRALIQYIGKKEDIAVNIVPTRGGAGARQAVLGGHVDLGFSGSNALPMMEDGALKIVAALNPEGISEHAQIPTLAALGYDVAASEAAVFFGPPDMDAEARAKLEAALEQAVQSEPFRDFVNTKFRGLELFRDGDETAASIARDAKAYDALLKVVQE